MLYYGADTDEPPLGLSVTGTKGTKSEKTAPDQIKMAAASPLPPTVRK